MRVGQSATDSRLAGPHRRQKGGAWLAGRFARSSREGRSADWGWYIQLQRKGAGDESMHTAAA